MTSTLSLGLKRIFSLTLVVLAIASAGIRGSVAQATSLGGSRTPAETSTDSLIKVGPGQIVSYRAMIVDATKPTFIFMPGIYRGWSAQDPVIVNLQKRGLNVVTMEFSTHYQSFRYLSELPHFAGGSRLDRKIFADEVQAVAQAVARSHRVRNFVPVSLSYSGIVTEKLDPGVFPLAIETAPQGRFDETNEMAARMGEAWMNWVSMIPLYGPIYAESMKVQAFFTYWSGMVAQMSAARPEFRNPQMASLQTQGWVSMARAAEDFDLRNQNWTASPKRVWILGEREEEPRATYQKEAVANYLKTLSPSAVNREIYGRRGVIVIPRAGHIVPSDEPELYVEALEQVLN
jgi:hypothetical protein